MSGLISWKNVFSMLLIVLVCCGCGHGRHTPTIYLVGNAIFTSKLTPTKISTTEESSFFGGTFNFSSAETAFNNFYKVIHNTTTTVYQHICEKWEESISTYRSVETKQKEWMQSKISMVHPHHQPQNSPELEATLHDAEVNEARNLALQYLSLNPKNDWEFVGEEDGIRVWKSKRKPPLMHFGLTRASRRSGHSQHLLASAAAEKSGKPPSNHRKPCEDTDAKKVTKNDSKTAATTQTRGGGGSSCVCASEGADLKKLNEEARAFAAEAERWPCMKAIAIIDAPPDVLADLLMDSSKVHLLNKYSVGRTDKVTFDKNSKIVWNRTKIPYTMKPFDYCTLMHSYKDPVKKFNMIISRGVEHDEVPVRKEYSRSEIYMGLNVLMPGRGKSSQTELTAINHVRYPGVPPFIASKSSFQGIVDYMKVLRRVAPLVSKNKNYKGDVEKAVAGSNGPETAAGTSIDATASGTRSGELSPVNSDS